MTRAGRPENPCRRQTRLDQRPTPLGHQIRVRILLTVSRQRLLDCTIAGLIGAKRAPSLHAHSFGPSPKLDHLLANRSSSGSARALTAGSRSVETRSSFTCIDGLTADWVGGWKMFGNKLENRRPIGLVVRVPRPPVARFRARDSTYGPRHASASVSHPVRRALTYAFLRVPLRADADGASDSSRKLRHRESDFYCAQSRPSSRHRLVVGWARHRPDALFPWRYRLLIGSDQVMIGRFTLDWSVKSSFHLARFIRFGFPSQ
jgi:hypothetical protein